MLLGYAGSLCAQSNQGPLYVLPGTLSSPTGNQIATVRYSVLWEMGPARVLGGDYWTDSSGQAIAWAARKPRQPGERHYQFTRILLGPMSFSFPVRPALAGQLAILIVLLFGIAAVYFVSRAKAAAQRNALLNPTLK